MAAKPLPLPVPVYMCMILAIVVGFTCDVASMFDLAYGLAPKYLANVLEQYIPKKGT